MTEKPEPSIATISLGGNTGDVAGAFCAALKTLAAHAAIRVTAGSSVWRTPPWGKTDQPDFLNMCVTIETSLSPHALLDLCLEIERAAGRERPAGGESERWGPRPLDMDIVTFGDLNIGGAGLTIPHPRAHERAFVLVPLAEIAPQFKIGEHFVKHLAHSSDQKGMSRDESASQRVQNA